VSHADPTMGHDAVLEERPFAMPSSKLVMWLFVISDAVTFAAVLFAYGYIRNSSPDWPTPFKFSPSIVNVMLMTFIMATSSLSMVQAVRSVRASQKSAAIRWTLITAALGLVFGLLHLREWFALIDEGLRMFKNPWGSGLFGAAFFSITGLHLSHDVIGVVALVVVAIGYSRGIYKSHVIEVWNLFWQFVSIVWMFVVPLLYLLNVER